MICPKCGSTETHRDEVDVGVGVITGPWGCMECGWSESLEYDLSELADDEEPRNEDGYIIDQFGGIHPGFGKKESSK